MGADIEEGKLLEWRIKPGGQVRKGDIIAVVDTTKAAIDLESWEEGEVYELVTQLDDVITVGTRMALFLEAGETKEQAEQWKTAHPFELPEAKKPEAAGDVAAKAARLTGAVPLQKRVSPAARRRAEALGVDVNTVTGTGPDNAVTIADVEIAAKRKGEAAPAAAGRDRAKEMRKVIGAAMARSKREIPHYYLSEDIPMQLASAWLTRTNAERDITRRLLMAPLMLKAVALALKKFPQLNGFWRDGEFVPSAAIHVGTAVSLRQGGLIAPAIHDVDQKDLVTLMKELADLVARTRAGSLKSSEMSDATITLTNLGDQGTTAVYGVIYPPQVALVGFGRISERAHIVDGKVAAVPMVTATLSADHRVTDGHLGALFLNHVRTLLQSPETL